MKYFWAYFNSKRFKKVAYVVCLTGLGLFAVWQLLETVSFFKKVDEPLPEQTFSLPPIQKRDLKSSLEEANLFGSSQQVEAGYGIKVVGIFLNNIPKQSRALLALQGEPAKSYGVNETLPNGARIMKITETEVFLLQKGKRVKLSFSLTPLNLNDKPPIEGVFTTKQ